MRGLLIDAVQTTLSRADAEAPQPVYSLGGIVAPTALSTAGERQRSQPLAEPEPTRAYAKLAGGLANRECILLLKHAPTLKLADKFI
jgi:hypothetical protein